MYGRREVLRAGAAIGLLAASPWLSAAAPASMLSRPIPSTDERLPVIGAGTSGSFEVAAGSADYRQLYQALEAFFAGGGRVIDTSPNYGGADSILGQLLDEGGWHRQCFIATKIAANSRADAQAQWAGTLRSLRTDSVDLLQVHNLRDWQQQLPYARELKQQGKTRYVGITHYLNAGHDEVAAIVRSQALDFIQINYAVNAPGAARELLPLCRDKGVAVLINRAFDDGRLFATVKDRALPEWAQEQGIGSWAQLFLKFALSHPAVTAVIPATGRLDRQLDQLKAGQGPLLTQAQQQALIEQFS
ncbi:aldo/keto reductase [Pseudomonas fulva]|jgi:diketogulonate reductase-like aldo/keto reductase|uniref:aldo/keto reductase n=1 Tax=Pseudomonas TaxID=286 RepID=UPI000483FE60|nr:MULTISPECIES: aldo/keto reductase [Pseudomonas]MBA1222690.1 aldo/keto reductase [Pseudomonas fulva]MBN4165878.1 aldo/keto reductase [Pseudomonas fulva]MDI3372994.1 aldo/keto reductase [Pseudomonas sp. V104_6]PZW52488.1 diketogulonate reductase-like aldo/keto reductase [Pseudomonas sp. URIL14HWK12:I2]PZW52589.1 diketogulonate reductase-like aldo/keto reductase [Pseudomonas sp. URIL14HWK12:I3]